MSKKLHIRCPLPAKDELNARLHDAAAMEGKTVDDKIYAYIRARIGDVLVSQEKIQREEMRIGKIKQAMLIALSLASDGTRKFTIDDILARCGFDMTDEYFDYGKK